MAHDPILIAEVNRLNGERLSYSQIGSALGLSRSTVAGIVYRHGLQRRPPDAVLQKVGEIALDASKAALDDDDLSPPVCALAVLVSAMFVDVGCHATRISIATGFPRWFPAMVGIHMRSNGLWGKQMPDWSEAPPWADAPVGPALAALVALGELRTKERNGERFFWAVDTGCKSGPYEKSSLVPPGHCTNES